MKIDIDVNVHCAQLPALAGARRIVVLFAIILIVISRGETSLIQSLLT